MKWKVKKANVEELQDALNEFQKLGYSVYKIESHPICDYVVIGKKTEGSDELVSWGLQ